MVLIFRATEGHAGFPAGFPILVADRMEIIGPVLEYLHAIATLYGRTSSCETLRQNGNRISVSTARPISAATPVMPAIGPLWRISPRRAGHPDETA